MTVWLTGVMITWWYWNPDLFTDVSSKTIRVRYFNSDITRKMRIVVEDFDSRGRLIHVEKTVPE